MICTLTSRSDLQSIARRRHPIFKSILKERLANEGLANRRTMITAKSEA